MYWKYELILREIFFDYNLEEEIPSISERVVKEIRESEAFRDKRLKNKLEAICQEFQKSKTEHEFNKVLDVLYDLGDDEKIWIQTF